MAFWHSKKIFLFVFALLASALSLADSETKRLIYPQQKTSPQHLSPDVLAQEKMLSTTHAKGVWRPDQHVKLINTTQSLLATHYLFQQFIGPYPLLNAQLSISIHAKKNNVQKLYDTTIPMSETTFKTLQDQTSSHIEREKAEAIVLGDFALSNNATKGLDSELVFFRQANKYRFVWKSTLSVSSVSGDWEYLIDAQSGEVVRSRRLDIPFRPIAENNLKHYSPNKKATQPAANEDEPPPPPPSMLTTGSAFVFDPDPATAIMSDTLIDQSAMQDFEPAYKLVDLLDIGVDDNGNHILFGPWVRVADIQEPDNAISQSIDGHWLGKRDEPAFLDVMAYYHIDSSQRYLQSLGYVGERGIQNGPIAVDPQGMFGVANARYSAIDNNIAFGVPEDCVPFVEDGNVIRHEYGHAIHAAINESSWGGGDTGAIGEGFSDYWAASYRYTQTNGKFFKPESSSVWIEQNNCVSDARSLDRLDIQYDPERNYQAHEQLGGYQSDELWSTPLFQSLKNLLALGVPREEVDTIIIEAQFGLGADFTMPDMATSIVHTAELLYPEGPHAKVFSKQFTLMNIFPRSVSLTQPQVSILGNGFVSQGTIFGVSAIIKNNSDVVVNDIQLSIATEHEGVESLSDIPNQLSLNSGEERLISRVFRVADNTTCGESLRFSAEVSYTDPIDDQTDTNAKQKLIFIGKPQVETFTESPNIVLSDERAEYTIRSLNVSGLDILPEYFRLHLQFQSEPFWTPFYELKSPSGTTTERVMLPPTLINEPVTLPLVSQGATLFERLGGENSNGSWELKLSDTINQKPARLKKWGISTVVAAECDLATTPISGPFYISKTEVKPEIELNEFLTGERGVNPGARGSVKFFVNSNLQMPITNVYIQPTDSQALRLVGNPPRIEVGDLPALSAKAVEIPFYMLPEASCGGTATFDFKIIGLKGEEAVSMDQEIAVSVGSRLRASWMVNIGPDRELTPDESGLLYQEEASISWVSPDAIDETRIYLNLEHSDINNLKVILASPEGTEYVVFDFDSGLPNYINWVSPNDTKLPDNIFTGENPNGLWTLKVYQRSDEEDQLKHLTWGLSNENASSCFGLEEQAPLEFPVESLVITYLRPEEIAVLKPEVEYDRNFELLEYDWQQTEGVDVELEKQPDGLVQFQTPDVSESQRYSFVGTAISGDGVTYTTEHTVIVTPEGMDPLEITNVVEVEVEVTPTPTPTSTLLPADPDREGAAQAHNNSSSGGGGAINGLMLLLLLSAFRCKKRAKQQESKR